MAIIGQLEKCESDFDGWMMLADLYANQFKDLPEAERTVHELCEEPATTMSQVSLAFQKLADWHLNLRGDPDGARRALEEICARMPGTHLAVMARHRINQLPDSREKMAEQQKTKTFHMPAPDVKLPELAEQPARALDPQEALALANQLVAKLTADPNDTDAREQLATVFAEQLGKPDLALEQLELLVGMTDQTPEKAASYLARMAAWQVKYRGGAEAARETLNRLVRDYPRSPQAFAAQKELIMMNMSAKIKRTGAALNRTKEGDDEE